MYALIAQINLYQYFDFLTITETVSGTIVTSKTSYVGYIYPFFIKRAGLMVTVLKLVTLVFAIMTLICKLGNRRDFFSNFSKSGCLVIILLVGS